MTLLHKILEAERRIRAHARETPLEASAVLQAATGCNVYYKLENLQHTGSFKFRGAISKMLALPRVQRDRGVIAASSGNHGMAVAYGAGLLHIEATIFVAADASPLKIERIRQLGGHVEFAGDNCVHAELAARTYARKNGQCYISPYNDEDVIAGQGTIGCELIKQLAEIDVVFVAVGGGGLISGIASYVKAVSPDIEVIGCQPQNSPVMQASIAAGRIVEIAEQPTLSDGTAGGIEKDAITFALCRKLVDDFVLISEPEIAAAVRRLLSDEGWLIEGAAGVAVAGFLQRAEHYRDKNVVIVLCGRNIAPETLKSIL